MRHSHRHLAQAGFTLNELLVAGLIASFILLLIWNFLVPFIKKVPRQQEAALNLSSICTAAQAYYNTPQYNSGGMLLPAQFPATQTATPPAGTCETTYGGQCPSSAWPAPWAALGNFTPGGSSFYNSYAFSTIGTTPNQTGIAWAAMKYGSIGPIVTCMYCYSNGTVAGPTVCPAPTIP